MILYHGSNQLITEIDLKKSRPNKDFGRAFYLSEDKKQALEMADFKTMAEGGEPVINKYEFDEKLMSSSDLKTKSFTEYSEEWAKFIFSNRDSKNGGSVHNYDIVYGPITNDRVGRQIANLKDGYITFGMFMERLKYIEGVTFQYAFCTELAISKLKRL